MVGLEISKLKGNQSELLKQELFVENIWFKC